MRAAASIDDILDKVTEFAKQAHGDQTRKFSPEPYINHPVRVMNTCREYTDDITMLAAALLHDVLEDTEVIREEMEEFLLGVLDKDKTQRTLGLVDALTDIYTKEDYPRWNREKRKTKEAERHAHTSASSQTIKYADLIDNVKGIAKADKEFAALFLSECRNLLKKINKGNKELYKRALEAVDAQMKVLQQSR
jgi:(p)ppGpp synthase/HD superfamily hydrolase